VKHPNAWLIIEAVRAHSEEDRRVVERLDVVEVPPDGAAAHRRYRELYRTQPERELYFAHTKNDELLIEERLWTGWRVRLHEEASR